MDRSNSKKRSKNTKSKTLLLVLAMTVLLVVGGTVAFLLTHAKDVKNTFTPSTVDCEVTESFDGTVKSNVNVTNTGDTEAYLRVKLISYRVNDQGQAIGGEAFIPDFTPGDGWVKYESSGQVYYYYTKPVAPGQQPETPLIGTSGIVLTTYMDADGGSQTVEVMAEAIQSGPKDAVGSAWGVSIRKGSVTAYTGN